MSYRFPAGEEGGPRGLPNLVKEEEKEKEEEEKKEDDNDEEEKKEDDNDEEGMEGRKGMRKICRTAWWWRKA